MRNKFCTKILMSVMFLCLLNLTLNAQEMNGIVKGSVTDLEGKPLEGVMVDASSTEGLSKNALTTTDSNGNFTIEGLISAKTYNLTFDLSDFETYYIDGFEVKEGDNNSIMVRMKAVTELEGVVVTALGIKREEKKLGYAQQTIDAEDLSTAVSNNWSSGLKGKVAGLNLVSGGTGPINSQKIQLRGVTSLNAGKNYALIVIDGIPMDQEMVSNGFNTAAYGTDSPTDFGNAISELNLNDIESVTVLKGPSAAALYGSRAANGVLMITTKSGKKGEGLGISYTSSITMDVVNKWLDWQYEYGQGYTLADYYSFGASEDGADTSYHTNSWGPKFNGQSFYQYDPLTGEQSEERMLWKPYTNNRKDFWETGFTLNNAITFQSGGEKGSMRASISHSESSWIMPNTGFTKYGASLNANYQISEKVKLSTVLNYNNRSSDNLPSSGYNNGSVAYFMMFLHPNVDINWYKQVWKPGFENLQQFQPFSNWSENPYLTAYYNTNSLNSNQIIGNIRTDFELTPHLNLMTRVALNSLTQFRETKRAYSSRKHAKGYYARQDVASQEINADFLLNYDNKIGDFFRYNLNLGGNTMSYEHRGLNSSVEGLVVPGIYKLSNGINTPQVVSADAEKKVNSLYGMLSLSFKNQIFLDITGRNDWSSTLPKKNNSYFYPSVSSSFILSDILNLPEPIDYLKYRLSYAQVGSDTDPYQTQKYYNQSGFPSSGTVSTTLFNNDLKPEMTNALETGFEYNMFNNRLGFDFTYYNTETKNQIISVPADITSGYSRRIINMGKIRNSGFEVVLRGTPVKTENFEWNITANWSTNQDEVLDLEGDAEHQIIATSVATIMASVGGSATELWGRKFQRDPNGNIIYSAGIPMLTPEMEYIGDVAPDWRGGLTNSFRYKNLKFSFTLDGQYGGLIYSFTHGKLIDTGILQKTVPGRDEGTIIGEGVVLNPDGSYSPNTVAVNTNTYYSNYYHPNNSIEANTFEGTYLKIRELSLTYQFPKKLIAKSGLNGLALTVFGRDLKTFSDFPSYDPETSALNGNIMVPGIEMGQMPSTATYGFSLKVDL